MRTRHLLGPDLRKQTYGGWFAALSEGVQASASPVHRVVHYLGGRLKRRASELIDDLAPHILNIHRQNDVVVVYAARLEFADA